jgi:hypothetical protein
MGLLLLHVSIKHLMKNVRSLRFWKNVTFVGRLVGSNYYRNLHPLWAYNIVIFPWLSHPHWQLSLIGGHSAGWPRQSKPELPLSLTVRSRPGTSPRQQSLPPCLCCCDWLQAFESRRATSCCTGLWYGISALRVPAIRFCQKLQMKRSAIQWSTACHLG